MQTHSRWSKFILFKTLRADNYDKRHTAYQAQARQKSGEADGLGISHRIRMHPLKSKQRQHKQSLGIREYKHQQET